MPLTSEPKYPSNQLDDPIGIWVFDYVMPAIWLAVLVAVVVSTVRTKKFSVYALVFLAGTSMFWIEWPADWGSYLVYNRNLHLFNGWTSIWYQTYWKPVGVVFGYGLFEILAAWVMLNGVPAIKRRFSAVNGTVVVVVSSAILFYAFDIIAEFTMVSLGWYYYVDPIAPALFTERGSLSFVWPAIPFLFFGIALGLLYDRRGEDGYYPNERLFGVTKVRDGLPRESLRLLAWIVTMNVLLFVFQPLITVTGRVLFLHDSVYVP